MRYYDINNQLNVSVTTALSILRKPYIERWRGEIGNEAADYIMKQAGILGSEVHGIAEKISQGKKWTVEDANIRSMVEAYRAWFAANVTKVVCVERVVVNTMYRYAGRLDLCAVIKGDRLPSLIDYKTGGIYPDVFLQLAAYQKAFDIKTKRRIVLHIDKKNPGKISVKEPEHDLETDYRMFLYCLELFRYFNRSQPKKSQIVKIGGNENVSIGA